MTSLRHDAWTDFELQCLYDAVNDIDWFDRVACNVRRSEAAIRTKMSLLRMEAGIVPSHVGPRASSRTAVNRAQATRGSDALARAIIAVRAPVRAPPPRPREECQLAFLEGPLFDFANRAAPAALEAA